MDQFLQGDQPPLSQIEIEQEMDITNKDHLIVMKNQGQIHLSIQSVDRVNKTYQIKFRSDLIDEYAHLQWSFEMDWAKSPGNAPTIQFDERIQHQSIIPGTGKMCLLELGKDKWRWSSTPAQVIDLVVTSFLTLPDQTPYPVDLQIVDLYQQSKEDYYDFMRDLKQRLEKTY